mmetsp:Transcript_23570/g.39533  ORF Transcript_23570/g.39533 Transcript_23570/m.39533 type:complete len:227 (+) Transcript_23570:562-1242(+)
MAPLVLFKRKRYSATPKSSPSRDIDGTSSHSTRVTSKNSSAHSQNLSSVGERRLYEIRISLDGPETSRKLFKIGRNTKFSSWQMQSDRSTMSYGGFSPRGLRPHSNATTSTSSATSFAPAFNHSRSKHRSLSVSVTCAPWWAATIPGKPRPAPISITVALWRLPATRSARWRAISTEASQRRPPGPPTCTSSYSLKSRSSLSCMRTVTTTSGSRRLMIPTSARSHP